MNDSQEQMRQAVREVAQELGRAVEQGGRLARQAADDLTRLVGDPRLVGRRAALGASPVELIRQLGELRAEGLITDGEFAAKKAELLTKI
jgi:CRP-like cAMP-binding protein